MTQSRILAHSSKSLLAIALLAGLSGCMSDSAAYLVDGDRNHTITLLRNQDWFWKDSVEVRIAPTRLPDCQESMPVKDVPRKAEMALYWAPDDYAEPIFILDIEGDFYAISTQTCKTQHFEEKPANPGTPLGVFKETDGRLGFEAASAAPAAQ
jgi:hypothetical protein